MQADHCHAWLGGNGQIACVNAVITHEVPQQLGFAQEVDPRVPDTPTRVGTVQPAEEVAAVDVPARRK